MARIILPRPHHALISATHLESKILTITRDKEVGAEEIKK
jgi:hypothetical protein